MFRWIRNLIRVQERREFRGDVIVLFAIFVGTMRVLMEFLLVGNRANPVMKELLFNISFYFQCFFLYAIPVRLFAPPPWQSRVNVVLVGLFMGIFPPLIDVSIYGWGNAVYGYEGFGYAYIFNFPEGWLPWMMSLENRSAPIGEGVALWLAVFFTTVYLYVKTASLVRALLGAAIAYCSCAFVGGVLPTTVVYIMGNYYPHFFADVGFIVGQTTAALAVYLLLFRWELLMLLFRRIAHGLPLVALALVGFGWVKPWDADVVLVALAVLLSAAMTIVQNDYWDALDETGAPAIVQRYDVTIIQFAWCLIVSGFLVSNSPVVMPFIAYGVVSYLYNAPAYRGKKHFPANIKMEGLAGGAAFLIGVLLAASPILFEAAQAVRIEPRLNSYLLRMPFSWVFGVEIIVAAFLAFGGWSVLVSMKDEKDIESDLASGSTNIFTLMIRRGRSPERVASVLRWLALISMLVAAWLPLSVGRSTVMAAGLMSALAAIMWLWRLNDRRKDFMKSLFIMTAHLFVLGLALSQQHG